MAAIIYFASFVLILTAAVRAQDPNSRAKDSNRLASFHVFANSFSVMTSHSTLPSVLLHYLLRFVPFTRIPGFPTAMVPFFWNGNGLGWEGIITVHGISYEYFGAGMTGLPVLKNLKKVVPLSVSCDS